jgi:arabinofuranan 3-O-arabinosyltransferase
MTATPVSARPAIPATGPDSVVRGDRNPTASRGLHPSVWATSLVYLVLSFFVFVEKWGLTTSDTRLDLTGSPGAYLRGTFSLWDSRVSLGQLQNQAYGYLFPQGLYFACAEAIGMAGWVSERLWSVFVLLLACEGMRRLARAMSISPWPAVFAGLAYGLSPRIVAELGVRSAEILPTAVIPWVLIPIIHVATGRRGHRAAAVLSAGAVAFAGGVNGTATAAPVAIVGIFVLWTVRRGAAPWTFVLWWGGLMAVVNFWWLSALLTLGKYSPPFFDYVEDARTTTATAGFAASLRGGNNWVNYIVTGDRAWWPAGYEVSFNPWIVLGSALVGALGIIGLARYRGPHLGPLVLSAAFGLVCLTLAHKGSLTSPIALPMQHLLDGPLASLRNIHKADPILRIPLAVGFAVFVEEVMARVARANGTGGGRRRGLSSMAAPGRVLLACLCLVAMAWPIAQGHLRTPGWQAIPSYWTRTASYLDKTSDGQATWVIPGSGFALQNWGWTMEEPLEVLASSPWVTRSEVPLTPAASIRMFASLENLLETGSGSPYLSRMLQRIGIDHVVVRHDLDLDVAQTIQSELVSVALARSPGLHEVRQFGQLDVGPAIEVFDVRGDSTDQQTAGGADAAGFQVRDLDETVTVGSGVEDMLSAVGAGLVDQNQPVVVRGDTGWEKPVDILGDGFRRRERNFGRIHDAESAVMAAGDQFQMGRAVHNYPGAPGAHPVRAKYFGFKDVTASSSSGYAGVLGPVRPENGPFAALDGDDSTSWQPAPFSDPFRQWLAIDLGRRNTLDEVSIRIPSDFGSNPVQKWWVEAGGRKVPATTNPFTNVAVAHLGNVTASRIKVVPRTVQFPRSGAPIGIAEVSIPGLHFGRTMTVPTIPESPKVDYLFSAAPERRACITTLFGPNCDAFRARASDESTGFDRTIDVPRAGTWSFSGLAVARAKPGTDVLLEPLGGMRGTASSQFGNDPTVSPRFAYDGDPTTSWIADPRDRTPTITLQLARPTRLDRLQVSPPSSIASVPTRAVIRTPAGATRDVDLSALGTFAPLRAQRLTITFSRPGDVTYQAIGAGDIRLGPSDPTAPFDGGGRTGSVCGFGPELLVDGRRMPTRVSGFLGSISSAGRLAVLPCGKKVSLTPGEHRIQLASTQQFQPVEMSLTARQTEASATPSRALTVLTSSRDRQRVRISSGRSAIVSASRNFNKGWVAEIGGKRLTPIEVDGWSQGWLLPAASSGVLHVSFAPQAGYHKNLVIGLVLLGLVLLSALAVLLLRRARPEPPQAVPAEDREPRRLLVAGVVAAVLALVLGGPLVLVGCVAGLLLRRRPRVVQVVSALALLVGVTISTGVLLDNPRYPPGAADLATSLGVALALASTLGVPRQGLRAR